MNPIQFHILTASQDLPILEEVIGDIALSFWWDHDGLASGIIEESDKKALEARLEGFFGAAPSIEFSELEGKDWLAEDQLRLEPIHVGNLFIYPPHYLGNIPEGIIPLRIDAPGAFGSGHHETTRSCLIAMQDLKGPVSKALDIGCGSGILAICIASLWGAEVVATELDPEAAAAAVRNIRDNGLQKITVLHGDGVKNGTVARGKPYDLIVANIHSDLLKDLAPAIANHLAKEGKVILSGILQEQEEDVLAVYRNCGLRLLKQYPEGQWSTLLLGT